MATGPTNKTPTAKPVPQPRRSPSVTPVVKPELTKPEKNQAAEKVQPSNVSSQAGARNDSRTRVAVAEQKQAEPKLAQSKPLLPKLPENNEPANKPES